MSRFDIFKRYTSNPGRGVYNDFFDGSSIVSMHCDNERKPSIYENLIDQDVKQMFKRLSDASMNLMNYDDSICILDHLCRASFVSLIDVSQLCKVLFNDDRIKTGLVDIDDVLTVYAKRAVFAMKRYVVLNTHDGASSVRVCVSNLDRYKDQVYETREEQLKRSIGCILSGMILSEVGDRLFLNVCDDGSLTCGNRLANAIFDTLCVSDEDFASRQFKFELLISGDVNAWLSHMNDNRYIEGYRTTDIYDIYRLAEDYCRRHHHYAKCRNNDVKWLSKSDLLDLVSKSCGVEPVKVSTSPTNYQSAYDAYFEARRLAEKERLIEQLKDEGYDDIAEDFISEDIVDRTSIATSFCKLSELDHQAIDQMIDQYENDLKKLDDKRESGKSVSQYVWKRR